MNRFRSIVNSKNISQHPLHYKQLSQLSRLSIISSKNIYSNKNTECISNKSNNILYFTINNRNFAQKSRIKSPRTPQEIRRTQLEADPSGLLKKALTSEEEFYREQGNINLSKLSKIDDTTYKDDIIDETLLETPSSIPSRLTIPQYEWDPHEKHKKDETSTSDDSLILSPHAQKTRQTSSKKQMIIIDGRQHELEPIESTYTPTAVKFGSKYEYDPKAHLPKRETMTIDRIFYRYLKPDGTTFHIREGANARVNSLIRELTVHEILELLRKPSLYKLFPKDLLDVTYQDMVDQTYELFKNGHRKEAKRMQYARRLLQHWWLQIKGKPPLKIERRTFI